MKNALHIGQRIFDTDILSERLRGESPEVVVVVDVAGDTFATVSKNGVFGRYALEEYTPASPTPIDGDADYRLAQLRAIILECDSKLRAPATEPLEAAIAVGCALQFLAMSLGLYGAVDTSRFCGAISAYAGERFDAGARK